MAFETGDIVATNRGNVGIFKGISKSHPDEVEFQIAYCDSYGGQRFITNHVKAKSLKLATDDHPKYKCIKCIFENAFHRPTKLVQKGLKGKHPELFTKKALENLAK